MRLAHQATNDDIAFSKMMLKYWQARLVRAESEAFRDERTLREIRSRIAEIESDLQIAA